MLTAIVTATISAAGALLVAVASYYFTKKREREADWRNEKLNYYKAFVGAITKALGDSPEGQIEFATACNNLLLFAPPRVIVALRAFTDFLVSLRPNESRQERQNELLSELFLEMRKDLGVKPQDDLSTFRVTPLVARIKSRSEAELNQRQRHDIT